MDKILNDLFIATRFSQFCLITFFWGVPKKRWNE